MIVDFEKINIKVDTMKRKINTIFLIFLFIFLISAVSAANSENETAMKIQQSDSNQDLYGIDVETDMEKLNVENTLSGDVKTSSAAKKKTTLTAPDVKMYYKDGSKFTTTLKYGKKAIQIRIQAFAGSDDQLDLHSQGNLSARADLKCQRRDRQALLHRAHRR